MAMGIRETIKKNSTAAVIVTALVAVGALGLSLRSSTSGPPVASTSVFYTVDEGANTFVADMARVPPFDHEGKTAVRVWMFTCDGGKTKFPGFLERLKPDAHKRITAALGAGKGPEVLGSLNPGDYEVKKPGGGNWVSKANFAESSKVTAVTCPGGGGDLEPVFP